MPTIFRHRVEFSLSPTTDNPSPDVHVFNVSLESPTGAQAWILDVCDGWKNSPELTANSTDYGPLRDGVSDADFFPMRNRFITVGGAIKGVTEAEAEELHDILVRDVLPRNRLLRMTRYETVPKYVEFRRVSGPNTEWTLQDGFRWDATLRCADPLKYSLEVQEEIAGPAGGSQSGVSFPITFPFSFTSISTGATITTATVVNEGTTDSSHVRITLTGPLSQGSWRIRNDTTDTEIWLDLGLTVGDTFLLDFANQTTYLNGFPFLGRQFGEWWSLAPGPNDIRLYTEYDPSTTITVAAESAWE
jgi:hypothetical protein